MKYHGKEIIKVDKFDFEFTLTLEDGEIVKIGPNELPPESYKWLFNKLIESQREPEDGQEQNA